MDGEIAEDKDKITVVPLCCAESPLSKVHLHSLVSHAVSCMLVSNSTFSYAKLRVCGWRATGVETGVGTKLEHPPFLPCSFPV